MAAILSRRAALQSEIDSAADAIRAELSDGDVEFAVRLAIHLFARVRRLNAGRSAPALGRPSGTGSREFDTFLLAGIRWALDADRHDNRPWAAPEPLPDTWYVYGFRRMSDRWKQLAATQTPAELHRAGILIRERSLTSV